MKIAFWSNVHGQTGTTSNTIAIAIMETLIYKEMNAIIQSHFNLNILEHSLIGRNLNGIENFDIGIDALSRDIKFMPLNEQTILNASISLLNKQLNLIPSTTKKNREIYEKDMSNVFNHIIEEIQKHHDNIFIDVCAGKNILSTSIVKESDIVVINLSQNKSIIDEFFNNYQLENKKVIYLIGNYNCDSKFNIKNLINLYPNHFNKKNLLFIPYNVEFLDAQNSGNVIQFFLKNIYCDKKDKNYYFIESVRNVTQLIMNYKSQEDKSSWLL